MNKIKCSNCNALNFEKVRICSNCRKSVSQSADFSDQDGNGKSKYSRKTQSADTMNVGKIILNALLLLGLGISIFFGYQKYSEWSEEQRKIEIAKQEQQEIDNFSQATFDADLYSCAECFLKLPKRFRVSPPDLVTLNSFPFHDKAVGRKKAEIVNTYVVPQQFNIQKQSYDNDGIAELYDKPVQSRMVKVRKIKNYTYSKNALGQLVVDVEFIGVFQNITSLDICPVIQKPCIYGSLHEGKGKLQVVRINDTWEIIAFEGYAPSSPVGVKWRKETDGVIDKNAPTDMIPTYEDTEIYPLSPDRDTSYRK